MQLTVSVHARALVFHELTGSVREAVELSKLRAVDVDHQEAAGRLLPAIYLAFNPERKTPSLDLGKPAIDRGRPARAIFETLFETEHERLLRAVFIVTGSAEEADELMQAAFVAVGERWDRWAA